MISLKLADAGRVANGFGFERRDCTVRALAVRLTTTYKRAHELCAEAGRQVGRGMRLSEMRPMLEKLGLYVQAPIKKQTLGRFVKEHPRGRYFVVILGHAMGLNNGVIQDTDKLRERARVLWYV